jgi:hypothetical protein
MTQPLQAIGTAAFQLLYFSVSFLDRQGSIFFPGLKACS